MSFKEWIMILSVIIIVIGWFVNSHLNRRHEIAKQRLDYRLNALNLSIPLILKVRNKTVTKNEVDELHSNLQLYANKNELKILTKFIETNNPEKLNELLIAIRNSIRKELDLEVFEL